MEATKNAAGRVPEILAMPPKWLNQYGEFITKNASAVSQIESGLRSLTYIIPGQFRESELASESLHTGVQLLSLYHDSLLAKAVARLPNIKKPLLSAHGRYTKYWTTKSPTYNRIALLLQIIKHTELFWEMAARRRNEQIRWRVVVVLEGIKAICRLLLLRLTNSRPLLSPPLPQREVDPSTLEEPVTSTNLLKSPPNESFDEAKWTMPRTGLSLPSLPQSSEISNYLLSKVLTADDIKAPKALLHRTTGKGEIAEWLYILRPLIYAFAMQHWAKDKSNWKPWMIGFSIEYGASQLARADFQERFAGGLRSLTGLEREELRKRSWAMGWWVMRGAFYENITRTWIKSFSGKFKGKLLLDMVSIIIDDYEFLWDKFYFSTATM